MVSNLQLDGRIAAHLEVIGRFGVLGGVDFGHTHLRPGVLEVLAQLVQNGLQLTAMAT